MNKFIITPILMLLFVFSAKGVDYELIATSNIEDSSGRRIKMIVHSALAHKQEHKNDIFTMSSNSVRLWMEPRTKESEEAARKAGTPIDGTSFSPNPKTVFSFSFNSDHKSCTGKNVSEQGTIDLINLMFYNGERALIRTENIAVMKPEDAKKFDFTISEHVVTLYVYWYDSIKENKEAEAPTYLIVVKDKENKLIASRAFYQTVKTTTREVSVFDLRAVQSKIDLNMVVNKLNEKLNEGFSLKTIKQKSSISTEKGQKNEKGNRNLVIAPFKIRNDGLGVCGVKRRGDHTHILTIKKTLPLIKSVHPPYRLLRCAWGDEESFRERKI